jgi:hypothetical protein
MKNNIVELYGPPGVGKSTLLRALSLKRSIKNPEFLSPTEAFNEYRFKWFSHYASQYSVKAFLSRMPRIQYLLYRNQNQFYNYHDIARKLDIKAKEYLEFCLNNDCSEIDSPIYRIKALNWILDVMGYYLLNHYTKCKIPVLFLDEGFLQKIFSVTSVNNRIQQNQYIENMPKANGYIFINAPIQTIIKRLNKRQNSGGKVTLRHNLLSNDNIMRKDTGMIRTAFVDLTTHLKSYNIPILVIDSTHDADLNSNLIYTFIKDKIYSSSTSYN